MRFRNIQEYHAYVRNKVARSGYSTDGTSIRFEPRSRTNGSIYAMALRFTDRAILRFIENIAISAEGEVHRISYSYHYWRSEANYFRYDRDPIAVKSFVHEECHLHVNQEEPRFKTHATSFDEIFDFVVAFYYAAP